MNRKEYVSEFQQFRSGKNLFTFMLVIISMSFLCYFLIYKSCNSNCNCYTTHSTQPFPVHSDNRETGMARVNQILTTKLFSNHHKDSRNEKSSHLLATKETTTYKTTSSDKLENKEAITPTTDFKTTTIARKENFLDGCYHVYLDVGSNIGIQVRKLFEPEKYPKAHVLPVYDKLFGNIKERRYENRDHGKRICAVGFEPNPAHTQYLKDVEEKYNKCGYRIKFMTETAVSYRDGYTTFYSDEAYSMLEWGGSILPPGVNVNSKQPNNLKRNNITELRLSNYLKNVVGKRKLPVSIDKANPPKIVMKMDIEGSEIDVMPDIIFTGGLQYINELMIEWHSRLERLEERKKAHDEMHKVTVALSTYADLMKKQAGHFNFKLLDLDDESYGTTRHALPRC